MIGRIFLGRYQAVRLLGQGGMGCAYLARDLRGAQGVVVKVMHEHVARRPKFRQRFERETALMARLRHPHAVAFLAELDRHTIGEVAEPHGPLAALLGLSTVIPIVPVASAGGATPAS